MMKNVLALLMLATISAACSGTEPSRPPIVVNNGQNNGENNGAEDMGADAVKDIATVPDTRVPDLVDEVQSAGYLRGQLSAIAVAGGIGCQVRVYQTSSIDLNRADLFSAGVVAQARFVVDAFPIDWEIAGLTDGDQFYVGALCDIDDDLQLDMVGGWYNSPRPLVVGIPSEGLDFTVQPF